MIDIFPFFGCIFFALLFSVFGAAIGLKVFKNSYEEDTLVGVFVGLFFNIGFIIAVLILPYPRWNIEVREGYSYRIVKLNGVMAKKEIIGVFETKEAADSILTIEKEQYIFLNSAWKLQYESRILLCQTEKPIGPRTVKHLDCVEYVANKYYKPIRKILQHIVGSTE